MRKAGTSGVNEPICLVHLVRAVELKEAHGDPIQCTALSTVAHGRKKKRVIIFIAGLLSGPISLRDSPALYSHNRNNNSHHPSREIPGSYQDLLRARRNFNLYGRFYAYPTKDNYFSRSPTATTFSTFFRTRLLPRNPSELARIPGREGRTIVLSFA